MDYYLEYELNENLGVTKFRYIIPMIYTYSYNYELLYANVQHYGVYGEYTSIFLDTETHASALPLDVRYDAYNLCIHINGLASPATFKLYDALARCVAVTRCDNGPIELRYLPDGIYFYNITGHQPASGKLWIH